MTTADTLKVYILLNDKAIIWNSMKLEHGQVVKYTMPLGTC